jgi:hypothetical protein
MAGNRRNHHERIVPPASACFDFCNVLNPLGVTTHLDSIEEANLGLLGLAMAHGTVLGYEVGAQVLGEPGGVHRLGAVDHRRKVEIVNCVTHSSAHEQYPYALRQTQIPELPNGYFPAVLQPLVSWFGTHMALSGLGMVQMRALQVRTKMKRLKSVAAKGFLQNCATSLTEFIRRPGERTCWQNGLKQGQHV